MQDLAPLYHLVRSRVAALVSELDEGELRRRVPACPEWDVHDLVAHVSGMADDLSAGRYPSGDLEAWIAGIVEVRRDVPVDELLARWDATEGRLDPILRSSGLLFADLVTHEHDLRGAVGRAGSRDAAELEPLVGIGLDLLEVAASDVAPLVIEWDGRVWASHEGVPGCTLHVDPWEAGRVLLSRRTEEELRATPATGDIGAYIALIAAHSPLPETSLGERA